MTDLDAEIEGDGLGQEVVPQTDVGQNRGKAEPVQWCEAEHDATLTSPGSDA